MTDSFTDEQVAEALENALALKGAGYVYPRNDGKEAPFPCTYSNDDGTPSCIVGHVIAELDPELFKKVGEWEKSEQGWDEGTAFLTVFYAFPTRFTPGQARALQRAQGAQDDGSTWGAAVRRFEESLRWQREKKEEK